MIGCQSTNNIVDNSVQTTKQNEKGMIERDSEDTNISFGFVCCDISYDETESVLDKNSLYSIKYSIDFSFINKNDKFTIDYQLYDKNNNELYSQSDLKPKKQDLHSYIVHVDYFNLINIDFFRYHLFVHINDNVEEFVGDVSLENGIEIQSLNVGPIITKYENDTLVTYLTVGSVINTNAELQWIRLIPPSQEYFWEIPYTQEGYTVNASAVINDTKHKRYIDNGDYIFQINAGRHGIIQSKISIVDFYNNTTGANYGFPVISELENDKNKIVLDINASEKINNIEILLYSEIENTIQKIGVAKPLRVTSILQKKS